METLTAEPPAKVTRRAFRRYSPPVLIAVVLLHLVLGGIATIWVVSKYSASRKLTFHAGPKSPNPSERALEHRVQLQKKLETVSAPPAVPRRVLTTGIAKVTLPPMPEIQSQEEAPRTMLGAGGAGVGFGTAGSTMSAGTASGGGAQINFFGIRDISSSVVIMIDVSDSMFGRTGDASYSPSKLLKAGPAQSFQVVRDEAIQLVKSLTPATRFGIVRWAGGAYSWKPELVPATEENKAAAIAHIEAEIDYHKAPKKRDRPGGTRHDYALEEAFKLKPETIYMLTDGNATGVTPAEVYKVAEEGQKTLPKKARLHVIYYLTGDDKSDEREFLQGLASRNSGKFSTVEAKNRNQGSSAAKKKKKRR